MVTFLSDTVIAQNSPRISLKVKERNIIANYLMYTSVFEAVLSNDCSLISTGLYLKFRFLYGITFNLN